ncbi:MAG: hypothetical protein BAJATHORv1_20250 [Candidatus Thorarchaeota archaeon]|nr:MAG: hypothetical protein BAJATHORv1_20250 [Candidatus Thorarchaeota archaeon]
MGNLDLAEIKRIQAAIQDLDLDYMRGLVNEEEYNKRLEELKTKMEAAGATTSRVSAIGETEPSESPKDMTPVKQAMTDPVTAVKKAIEKMRRISIEKIAQEAGVSTLNASRILSDLLDGRDLSGRIDHDAGDFILGTGTGPTPKSIAVCPYCKKDLKRIAVKGETITCSTCRDSFIVS